jgi:tRNA A-37 threonylcarbamoyl transferase component Bud32
MSRIRKFGVPTPALYLIDEVERRIYMEYLGFHAFTVKEFLYQLKSFDHPSKIILFQLCSFGLTY